MLDMLVEEIGQIRCLVRVKGRFATKNKAQLQPFTQLEIKYKGEHELKFLDSFAPTERPLSLQGKALYCGFYLNELSNRLIPLNEPNEYIYRLYDDHIRRLTSTIDYEPVLRSFEFQLIELLGIGVDFHFDVDGKPLAHDKFYQYQNEIGWSQLDSNRSGLSGKQIEQIANLNFNDKVTRQLAKQLARYLLHPLLGYRELKSRELFS